MNIEYPFKEQSNEAFNSLRDSYFKEALKFAFPCLSVIAVCLVGILSHAAFDNGYLGPVTAILFEIGFSLVMMLWLIAWGFRKVNSIQEYNYKVSASLEKKIEERTSEYVQALELAKKKRIEYQDLFESAADAILIADIQGVIRDMNQCALDLLGYSRHELLGKKIADIIPIEEVQKVIKIKDELLEKGGFLKIESRLISRSGEIITVEVSTKMYPDGRWLAYIRDIGKQKKELQRLAFLAQLNEMFNHSLGFYERLQNSSDSIVELMADASYIVVKKGLNWEIGGQTSKDSISKEHNDSTICSILDSTHENIFNQGLNPLLITQFNESDAFFNSLEIQTKVFLKNLVFGSYMRLPLISRGEQLGTLHLFRAKESVSFNEEDFNFAQAISDRLSLAADNSILLDEFQSAIHDREHLLSIVSHDLKNPLYTIGLATKSLKENLNLNTASINQIAKTIDSASQLMNNLIRDLLDFGKIQAGTFVVNKKHSEVYELIYTVVDLLKLSAIEKQLRVRIDVANGISQVDCDRVRILQVFWNLLSNSVKFTPTGGRINIRAEQQDKIIKFTVQDTGKGISRKDLNKIFEKFWQADDTKSLGTGLGLNIAKGIIQAHGGEIWAEIPDECGSKICFTLPIASRSNLLQKQGSQLPKVLDGKLIYCVDDSPDILLLMGKFLKKAGADVLTEVHASSALNHLRTFKDRYPDLIVTDIDMPEMNGIEFMHALQAEDELKSIPVVAITGHRYSEEISGVGKHGFSKVITKTSDFDSVMNSLAEVFQSI